MAYVILDGKIFSADRCSEKTASVKGKQIDLRYSGKAHEHGGNIWALSEPDGFPLWVGDVQHGSVHDLTAAPDPCSALCTGPRLSLICRHWRGFAVLTGRRHTLRHITASPAKLAPSSRRHWSSPNSNADDSHQVVESTSFSPLSKTRCIA